MRKNLWIVFGLILLTWGTFACSNSSSHFTGDLDIELDLDSDGDVDADADNAELDESADTDTDGEADNDADSDAEPSEVELEEIDGTTPVLLFLEDTGTWSITYAQDSDTEAAGMQADIRIQAANLPAGTYLSLKVDGVAVANATLGENQLISFPKITLQPGANVLQLFATPSATVLTDLAHAKATLTLKGCRLRFTTPLAAAALSDAGPTSDCKTSCGDDLDCNKPNLQYDVKVAVENVPATKEVELNVAGVKTKVAPQDGIATFTHASLPNGVSLALDAKADLGEGLSCDVSRVISVAVTCSCHLTLDPTPKAAYNAADSDDDTELAGFQRKFSVSSDNCADGSRVHVNLDGVDTSVILAAGKADFTLTLSETAAEATHTLSLNIVETGTGREGEAGPYSFRVDRTAPAIESLTVNGLAFDATKTYTIADDGNQTLSDGVELAIGGITSGVENDQAVSLKVDGVAVGSDPAVLVKTNAYSFPRVLFAKPENYTGGAVDFALEFALADKAGNPGTKSATIRITFDQPTLTITKISNRAVTSNMALNQDDDVDTELPGVQVEVEAASVLLPQDTNVGLQVGMATPVVSKVGVGDVVTWIVTLGNGTHSLKAAALLGTYAVLSEPLTVVMNSLAPTIAFVPGDGSYATDGSWIKGDTVNVKILSDAGEGQLVTLHLGTTAVGDPVPLDAQGYATFNHIAIGSRKFATLTLEATVKSLAGNTGAAHITLYRDTQVPVVTVTLDGTSPLSINENIRVNLSVQEDALAEMVSPTAKLELFDTTPNPARSLGKVDAPIDALGAGSHSYPFIANGSYKVVATLSDKAGNSGTGEVAFVVNTPCYTVTVTTPNPDTLYGPSAALGGDISKGVCVPIAITTNAPPSSSTAPPLLGRRHQQSCRLLGRCPRRLFLPGFDLRRGGRQFRRRRTLLPSQGAGRRQRRALLLQHRAPVRRFHAPDLDPGQPHPGRSDHHQSSLRRHRHRQFLRHCPELHDRSRRRHAHGATARALRQRGDAGRPVRRHRQGWRQDRLRERAGQRHGLAAGRHDPDPAPDPDRRRGQYDREGHTRSGGSQRPRIHLLHPGGGHPQ